MDSSNINSNINIMSYSKNKLYEFSKQKKQENKICMGLSRLKIDEMRSLAQGLGFKGKTTKNPIKKTESKTKTKTSKKDNQQYLKIRIINFAPYYTLWKYNSMPDEKRLRFYTINRFILTKIYNKKLLNDYIGNSYGVIRNYDTLEQFLPHTLKVKGSYSKSELKRIDKSVDNPKRNTILIPIEDLEHEPLHPYHTFKYLYYFQKDN